MIHIIKYSTFNVKPWSGTKPLPEPVSSQIYVTKWHHYVTMIKNRWLLMRITYSCHPPYSSPFPCSCEAPWDSPCQCRTSCCPRVQLQGPPSPWILLPPPLQQWPGTHTGKIRATDILVNVSSAPGNGCQAVTLITTDYWTKGHNVLYKITQWMWHLPTIRKST